jgi:hypothetical protein
MQTEQKVEAYRVEALRTSIDDVCFNTCVANESWPTILKQMAAGTSQPVDLTNVEAVCVDRCAWKYLEINKLVHKAFYKAKLDAAQTGKR